MQDTTPTGRAIRSRLRPLHVAVALQGFGLWVPIEKLFMADIGFDAAAVGLMAAAYAAVVPLVELPSGILADRWSRRGVLMIAIAALAISVLVCGVSTNVVTYIAGAMLLGVYFAMYSGTLDAIVYDTVLEETGDGHEFERRIGRVRSVESASLVASALLGGWVAGVTSTRLTYFVTLPFMVASLVVLRRFREPLLHRAAERASLRQHVARTYRTLGRGGRLLPIVALAVVSSMLLSAVFEFGPLWLVAFAVPAVLWGPYWAGLVSSLGLGGVLAGRVRLDRPVPLSVVVVLIALSSLIMGWSRNAALVIGAQILLALLIVLAGIHVTGRLHDAVPSAIRTGVASGVGAISWIVFVPFALGFGQLAKSAGVHSAGWMIFATALVAGGLLIFVARRGVPEDEAAEQAGCDETLQPSAVA